MKKLLLSSILSAAGAIALSAFLGVSGASANVRLNPIFSDNMVFQRGVRVPFWGTAAPGEAIRVLVGFQVARTVADSSGNWETSLPAMEATSRPFDVTIIGENNLMLRNVVVGDVWVCGGQSNMEWTVGNSKNAAAEIASANFPALRYFTTAQEMSDEPKSEIAGHWQSVTPQTVADATAVGYFFGREINQKTGIPIGLLNSNWGGTVAEAWTSRETLESDPQFRPLLDRFIPASGDNVTAQKEYQEKLKNWQSANQLPYSEALPKTRRWSAPDFDDAAWKEMPAPGLWEDTLGLNIDGAVWVRKTIEIPAAWAGRDLKLSLGALDDWDTTYFNGARVGSIGPKNEDAWKTPREYSIPGAQVKSGRSVIAIRIFDRWGGGGFGGRTEQMTLAPTEKSDSAPISLSGVWRYAIEFSRDSSALPSAPAAPYGIDSPDRPTVLFNSKIAPLLKFPVRGVIWYQGESNVDRSYQYRALLPAMIGDWRSHWNKSSGSSREFPFYIVQLANFMARQPQPAPSSWAELREAQAMTARNVPHSGLAVAIDIGEENDVHPRDKQSVGYRLALLALVKDYGKSEIEYSGPQYSAMKIEKDTIRISLSHAAGLNFKGAPQGFEIAGADRKFVWAKARIDGDSVVVSSALVPNPIAVRYAWADNPAAPLYNGAALPAVPFRTDDWPGITANNK